MVSRAKNTAELMDYVKALRANIETWHNGFVSLNLDEVAGAYQDFLVDLLNKTARPTKDLLLKAAKSTHKEVPEPELAMFVDNAAGCPVLQKQVQKHEHWCQDAP